MERSPEKCWWIMLASCMIGICFGIGLTIITTNNNERVSKTVVDEIPTQDQINQPTQTVTVNPQPKNIPTQKEIINNYVKEISAQYNIQPKLIESIIFYESRYEPDARNGDCVGLMQVSTYWHKARAKKLGVTDLYDPYGNILVGVDYLSELFKRNKDPALVLMLYNMDHNTAFALYKKGKVSGYARAVLARSDALQQEVY